MKHKDLPRCSNCKHLNENPECPAFPDGGIPDEFLSGKVQHNTPIEGQVGDYVYIRFKLPPRIQELFDKNFYSFQYMQTGEVKITAAEYRELTAYFKKRSPSYKDLHSAVLGEMLLVSHPDYGKEDKYGFIKII